MNNLIDSKTLGEIGFTLSDTQRFEDLTAYEYDVFTVLIRHDNPEMPIISIFNSLKESEVSFPGASTRKDLKDLMFFHYGEAEYNERFGHLPAEIVE